MTRVAAMQIRGVDSILCSGSDLYSQRVSTTNLAIIMTVMALLGWGPGGDPPPGPVPEGMVWIPGGTFQMGSTGPMAHPDEGPVHEVRVSGFFIDRNEVTNDDYAKFVEATGYRTIAERPIDWEELRSQLPPGTPKPADEVLQPGSLVFVQPGRPVAIADYGQWWRWTQGASWRHPEGPGSSIVDRGDHPVVQIAWPDAVAYAEWAGKRLPTEAEWEFAARGGLEGASFVWGEEPPDGETSRANIWQGTFPNLNTKLDGYQGTAPVGSYPANGHGLNDMAGNVWEWCTDWYRPDTYRAAGEELQVDPKGPERSFDPREPFVPKHVTRGGSFLCHESYCLRYRPSARIGTAADSGMSHLGFRCVEDAPLKPAEAQDPATDSPS